MLLLIPLLWHLFLRPQALAIAIASAGNDHRLIFHHPRSVLTKAKLVATSSKKPFRIPPRQTMPSPTPQREYLKFYPTLLFLAPQGQFYTHLIFPSIASSLKEVTCRVPAYSPSTHVAGTWYMSVEWFEKKHNKFCVHKEVDPFCGTPEPSQDPRGEVSGGWGEISAVQEIF